MAWSVRGSKPGRGYVFSNRPQCDGFKPATCKMVKWSPSRGKRSGFGIDHPPRRGIRLHKEQSCTFTPSLGNPQKDFWPCWRVYFIFLCLLQEDNIFIAVEWLLSYTTSQYAQLYVLLLYSRQSANHPQTSEGISWQLIRSYSVGWLLNIELSDCCIGET